MMRAGLLTPILFVFALPLAYANPQEKSRCTQLTADVQRFEAMQKLEKSIMKEMEIQIQDMEVLLTQRPGLDFPKPLYEKCYYGKVNLISNMAGYAQGKATLEYNKLLIRFYRLVKNLDKEIESLENAYRAKPDKNMVLEWWDAWFRKIKNEKNYNPESALEATKKVMASLLANSDLTPKQKAKALEDRAEWFRYKQNMELAFRDYNLALTFEPDSFVSLVAVGAYFLDRSQYGEAKKTFQRVELLTPTAPEIQEQLLICEAGLGEWAQYVERVERNRFYEKLRLPLKLKFVEALLKLSRFEQADSLIVKLQKENPKLTQLKEWVPIEGLKAYLKAQDFERRGLVANAFAQYARAVELQPRNADFRYQAALYIYKIHEGRNFEKTPAFQKDMKKALEYLQMPAGVSENSAIVDLKKKINAL